MVSRLYFPRKLRSFSVCRKAVGIFYHSVAVSAVYFVVVY